MVGLEYGSRVFRSLDTTLQTKTHTRDRQEEGINNNHNGVCVCVHLHPYWPQAFHHKWATKIQSNQVMISVTTQ